MLAGRNDHAGVEQTGEGRAINRHNYSTSEAKKALEQLVVQRLLRLIRLRNEHPAFEGSFTVLDSIPSELRLEWRLGDAYVLLEVDLRGPRATIRYSNQEGRMAEDRIE